MQLQGAATNKLPRMSSVSSVGLEYGERNRMEQEKEHDVIFQHLIDLPQCQCVFAAAKERTTGKNRLFLFQHEKNQIFRRDPLRDTWLRLIETDTSVRMLRERFLIEIERRRIPCFQATNLDVFTLHA